MLDQQLPIIEFLVYMTSLVLLLTGFLTKRRHIISWSFSLVLLNTLLYAGVYDLPSPVFLILVILSSISILTTVSIGIIAYIIDRNVVKKY